MDMEKGEEKEGKLTQYFISLSSIYLSYLKT
jgi:hypothetical protein